MFVYSNLDEGLKKRVEKRYIKAKNHGEKALEKVYSLERALKFAEKDNPYVEEIINTAEIYFNSITMDRVPYFNDCAVASIRHCCRILQSWAI